MSAAPDPSHATGIPSVSRNRPLPAQWTVREARDLYLAENGFRVESYDAWWTDATLFGVSFKVINTRAHRHAIMMHDLHHVALGYGTDLTGEAEISAWETRRGLGGIGWLTPLIVVTLTVLGWIGAARRVRAAWRDSGDSPTRASLFRVAEKDYAGLLDLRVGELRERLGIPRDGLAREPRRLHPRAPRLP